MSVEDEFLHLIARVAIRMVPPMRAKQMVDAVGALFRPLDVDRAIFVARGLRKGTCLSRSLAVAARLPRSEVIIGVQPTPTNLAAHAWVEFDGSRIGEDQGTVEVGRFR